MFSLICSYLVRLKKYNSNLTIAGTATAFSFRLRLHYKAARAAGVSTYETEKNPNDRNDCLYSSCGTNLGERGQRQLITLVTAVG